MPSTPLREPRCFWAVPCASGAAAAQKPCAGGFAIPLLLAMSTENFLAFGPQRPLSASGRGIGWAAIPLMNANLDVLMRTHIPIAMPCRVCVCCAQYAAVLHHSAGVLCRRPAGGQGIRSRSWPPPGREACCAFCSVPEGLGRRTSVLPIGTAGAATCLVFRRDRQIWALECPDGGALRAGKRPAALSRTAHSFPCTASIS